MKKRTYNKLSDAKVMERDNVLADFIFNHKGAENVVSSKEIAEYLTAQGYPQKERGVHALISRLREQKHLPICSLNGKGYFWAASKSDLQITIADLELRAKAMQESADMLKAFIYD